ncbi:hypothetical protein BC628DRAFT_1326966 [Trametes gibbosa]|nr:hypothetical protein BC628DRAFT_1326966 [Trametes gibbosa]
MHTLHNAALSALLILWLVEDNVRAQQQYTASPRWGQATALVDDALFVQGGRTDQFNAYGYSSAPVNNDILLLPLNATFNLSSPPWQYIAGCSNCTSSQGPAVAWHTLSAFNTTNVLLFGGDAGPNGPIANPEEADSAALLTVADRTSPVWTLETESWANEPLRRIYHSSSSTGGKIWLIGGEKADGSDNAFSDHYVYDPAGPSFTQLPSTNGPPDIFGHASIVLPDQRLIVLGGYSPSQTALLPFSTVWFLDTTQPTLTWSTLSVSTSSLPSPRRGFAATLLDNGNILIQGGADADMQNIFSDGWVLDTSQNPMVWSSVDALSQVGPRRDHFAIALGSEVLFGFGYAQSAPVNASLLLFDASKGTFISTYTPPAAVTSPTSNTVPGPTATASSSGHLVSGTAGGSTETRGGSFPSSTGQPDSGGNGGGGTGNGDGNGSNPVTDPAGASSKSHTTAVALGVVLGVLGLVVGGTGAYYMSTRRRASDDRFHMLGASDDDDSPHLGPIIPVAGAAREKSLPVVQTVREKLGGLVSGRTTRLPQRRDMLADEDTRMFDDLGWYHIRRDGSVGSWSTRRGRPTIGDVVQDSLTSLRSVGGAMLAYASGTRSSKDREVSGASSNTYWEKGPPYEPYSDKTALVGLAGIPQAASRPKGGRKASYTSQWSYYENPFAEYEVDAFKLPGDEEYDSDPVELGPPPSLEDPPPRPYTYARVAPAMTDATHLSPLSEKPSLLTVSDPTASSDSSHANSSPYAGSLADQLRSPGDAPHSPRRPSSIIDANPPIMRTMRRSDSWWSKFAKTPILDRLSTDSSRTLRPLDLDFRDPNPPPRTLVPIKESSNSLSPEEPPSRHGGRHDDVMYASVHHGRSASSLQTSKTADSEVIERMGRTMDIVQQGTISSHASGASTDSGATADAYGHPPASPSSSSASSTTGDYQLGALAIAIPAPVEEGDENPAMSNLVQSPTAMSATQAAGSPSVGRDEARRPSPPRRLTPGSVVAARIAALEQQARSPPPQSRSKKARGSVYGLAPKPSLFIANPDRRGGSGSGDS